MANSNATTKYAMTRRREYVEVLLRDEAEERKRAHEEERYQLQLIKAGIAFAKDLGLDPVSSEYVSDHDEFGGQAIELMLRGSYGEAFLRILSYVVANDGILLAANSDGMDRFTLFIMGPRGLMLWGSGHKFGLSVIQK